MTDYVNQLISNGGVSRNALATPGLLKNIYNALREQMAIITFKK